MFIYIYIYISMYIYIRPIECLFRSAYQCRLVFIDLSKLVMSLASSGPLVIDDLIMLRSNKLWSSKL